MKLGLTTDLTLFNPRLPLNPENSLELSAAQDSAINPKA